MSDKMNQKYKGDFIMGLATFNKKKLPGTTVNSTSVETALTLGGLNWGIQTAPLYYSLGGQMNNMDKQQVILRNDTMAPLGITSKHYKPIENQDVFHAVLDELHRHGGNIETAGMCGKGEKVWMCVSFPGHVMMGDEYLSYIVVVCGHDGKTAVSAIFTNLRCVCSNMFAMIRAKNKGEYRFRHMGQRSTDALEGVLKAELTFRNAFRLQSEKLAKIPLPKPIEKMAEVLYPVPLDCTERLEKNIINRRDYLVDRYKEPDNENFKGTAFGLYNAAANVDTRPLTLRNNARFTPISAFINGETLASRVLNLFNN